MSPEKAPIPTQIPNLPPDGQFNVLLAGKESDGLPGSIDQQTAFLGKQATKDYVSEYYRLLTADDETPVEAQQTDVESPKNPHLEEVFAPIKTVDQYRDENPADRGYDDLFTADEAAYKAAVSERSKASQRREQAEKQLAVVTDETRALAGDRLVSARRADPSINRIISSWQRANPDSNTASLVDAIRTDADLRYKLGSYLYNDKLTLHLDKMPELIERNAEKRPNHRGYDSLPRLHSREYACLLALSMIDGTYELPGRGDPVQLDAHGKAVLGQHRAAAEELLS